MSTKRLLKFLVVVLLVAASCGGSDDGGGQEDAAGEPDEAATEESAKEPTTGEPGVGAELAAARGESPDGLLPTAVALDLFASVYGEMPGGTPRFDEVRTGDPSLAIAAVMARWDELDEETRAAIRDALRPEPKGTEGAAGTALAARPPTVASASPASRRLRCGAWETTTCCIVCRSASAQAGVRVATRAPG